MKASTGILGGCIGVISFLMHAYDSAPQGVWTYQNDASQFMNGYILNTSDTDGDSLNYKAYLEAGTYTLRILCVKAPNCAKVDIDIGGTEVATFDCYAGAGTYHQVLTQTGIVIDTPGIKDILVHIDGKNGSATNYQLGLTSMALWRTA